MVQGRGDIDTVATPSHGSRLSANNVHFTPGARAAPRRFMTHLATYEAYDEGNSASWGGHITDDEYAAALTGEEEHKDRYQGLFGDCEGWDHELMLSAQAQRSPAGNQNPQPWAFGQ